MFLHQKVSKFKAKRVCMKIYQWQDLFAVPFVNLHYLNLALSCCDEILELIPNSCPNLEILNATSVCNFRMKCDEINATAFMWSVSDAGLEHLSECKHLKVLTVNEPRSLGRGISKAITYSSLQKLLRDVPTLEDIVYKNLGAVIGRDFTDVAALNLKVMRHVNPTVTSTREIIRLCKKLECLQLILHSYALLPSEFFDVILESRLQLKTIRLDGIPLGNRIIHFFRTFGPNLSSLWLINVDLTTENLQTIGEHCLNIESLLLYQICEPSRTLHPSAQPLHVSNQRVFSKMVNLTIGYTNVDIENVLIYCTKNAKALKMLYVEERIIPKPINRHYCEADQLFLNVINSNDLETLEIGKYFVFTVNGLRQILQKCHKLKVLNVYSINDCNEIVNDMKQHNYDISITISSWSSLWLDRTV